MYHLNFSFDKRQYRAPKIRPNFFHKRPVFPITRDLTLGYLSLIFLFFCLFFSLFIFFSFLFYTRVRQYDTFTYSTMELVSTKCGRWKVSPSRHLIFLFRRLK